MNNDLKSKIERHQEIELRLRLLLLAWRISRRQLAVLNELDECIARITEATPRQQALWRRFRATHSLGQVAGILDLLAQRRLTISDFVEVWLKHGSLRLAVHALWRTPNAGR